MVDEISPNYYAAGEMVGNFVLRGSLFDRLPDDAVGVIAVNNNLPLRYRDTTEPNQTFRIASKTSTLLEFEQVSSSTHSLAAYLGAIVSADRETVYWVNDTRPLPS